MLKMASIIAGARAFVGLMSAPLVIANGFSIPKIVPCLLGNGSGDLRHLLRSPKHHYLVNPDFNEMLSLI
jgi:hypothetical protein